MADAPDQPSLIQQIESRQDEVMRMLDELEMKLNQAIRESQLSVVGPVAFPQSRAA